MQLMTQELSRKFNDGGFKTLAQMAWIKAATEAKLRRAFNQR